MNLFSEIIEPALVEISENFPNVDVDRVRENPSLPLFGQEAMLDSLGLVNLLIAIEERIEDKMGISVTIASEKAMSLKNSPFRSTEALQKYIETLVKEN